MTIFVEYECDIGMWGKVPKLYIVDPGVVDWEGEINQNDGPIE